MRAILGTISLEPNRWTPYHDPKMDLIELLPEIKEAGFDKLEVWQWHVTTRCMAAVRDMKAKGDELGISFPYICVYPSFVGSGADWGEQERMQADVLDKAEILGATAFKIMLGCGTKGGEITPDQMALTVERFGRWYREAKSRGIGMCAELHGGSMFDPTEAGEKFMQENPELDFGICFQPMDFTDTEKAIALADRFGGRISHVHLQAPQPKERGGMYDLLEECALDYRKLLPHILESDPDATMTLEFVKGCIQQEGPFRLAPVLVNARKDADFVAKIV